MLNRSVRSVRSEYTNVRSIRLAVYLSQICECLSNNGCPIAPQSSSRGASPKGESPWEKAYKWLWEVKFRDRQIAICTRSSRIVNHVISSTHARWVSQVCVSATWTSSDKKGLSVLPSIWAGWVDLRLLKFGLLMWFLNSAVVSSLPLQLMTIDRGGNNTIRFRQYYVWVGLLKMNCWFNSTIEISWFFSMKSTVFVWLD